MENREIMFSLDDKECMADVFRSKVGCTEVRKEEEEESGDNIEVSEGCDASD